MFVVYTKEEDICKVVTSDFHTHAPKQRANAASGGINRCDYKALKTRVDWKTLSREIDFVSLTLQLTHTNTGGLQRMDLSGGCKRKDSNSGVHDKIGT